VTALVPVDTGLLVVVDPAHIPIIALPAILGAGGAPALGALLMVPGGDGLVRVRTEDTLRRSFASLSIGRGGVPWSLLEGPELVRAIGELAGVTRAGGRL